MIRLAAVIAAGFLLAACGGERDAPHSAQTDTAEAPTAEASVKGAAAAPGEPRAYVANAQEAASLNAIATEFVRLVLAIGEHDPDFVDAYHGPQEWAVAVREQQRPLAGLHMDAQGLLISIARANADDETPRGAMLEKLVRAALTRIEMLEGDGLSFDDETRLLYDAVAPAYDLAAFDAVLAQIDALAPGDAPLNERVDALRNQLAIPADRLEAVFAAAIKECRARALAHFDLPEDERFALEFVTDKPWSGYNWYQGDYNSLIQVNTDIPIIIDRAVELGCHEGFPGHHMWNVLLERDLLGAAGWVEYSVYPLFSPLSLIAEGSAQYGVDLVFPDGEKAAFERDVLFPLAGLDPALSARFVRLNALRRQLEHAEIHIARAYLDHHIDGDRAIELLKTYRLESRERAEQRLRFIETYRGYILNYSYGRDLVADYVKRNTTKNKDMWNAFAALLSAPHAASDLIAP